MSEEPVLVEVADGVCRITLNRPEKLNTITTQMLGIISEALDRAEADDSVRCVLVTGAGDRAFSAGADVNQFSSLTSEEAKGFSRNGQETFKKMLRMTKPVVAAVNGFALGGGCELASFCDYRIAHEKARFGHPEVNLGLIPGWGGTYILRKLVGRAKALELITTGAIINAEEAYKLGLVNKLVSVENFQEEVEAFLESLKKGPPIAYASVKALVAPDLEDALDAESIEFGKLFDTEDLKEGVAAFKEKRKPVFKGE